MLDKSIPFKNIIMRLSKENLWAVTEPVLPEGFSFAFFKPGMERDWAEIEYSVLEFKAVEDAEAYLNRHYVTPENELDRRCVFVLNPDGVPVATANAWYADTPLGYQLSLHWVAARPEYQGLGLGRAVVKRALRVYQEQNQHQDVWLHTQTWSHRAIRLYYSLGFRLSKSGVLASARSTCDKAVVYGNDYAEAIKALEEVVPRDELNLWIETSV